MKVMASSVLLVAATVLLTFFGLAFSISPPTSTDSRDVLIMAIGAAGVAFAILAVRELRKINAKLK